MKNPWVLLRFHRKDDLIWISYQDWHQRRQLAASFNAESHDTWQIMPGTDFSPMDVSPSPHRDIFIPKNLGHLVQKTLDKVPATLPGPLPVFVAPLKEDWFFEDLLNLVDAILKSQVADSSRLVPVLLANHRWSQRPPFTLPLKIAAVGAKCWSSLKDLRERPWYSDSEALKKYGLIMNEFSGGQVARAIRSSIVLVDQALFPKVLISAWRVRQPLKNRPRLIFVLDEKNKNPNWLKSFLPLPPGIALIWAAVPAVESATEFVKELIYDIIHDQPLHLISRNFDPLRSADFRSFHELPERISLIADPLSLFSLRISQAFDQQKREAFQLDTGITPGDYELFLDRLSAAEAKKFRGYLSVEDVPPIGFVPPPSSLIRNRAIDIFPNIGFDRESSGLVPMSEAQPKLNRIYDLNKGLEYRLAKISNDPPLREAVQENQERRVDIALEQRNVGYDEWGHEDYRTMYDDMLKNDLACKQYYRLRVHIGNRQKGSLITGKIPPIDPLLPDPINLSGHNLEVAVFEKDFILLSPRVQVLYLPLLGGSQPVYFELQAPAMVGHAQLRIGVYHKDHLLQSFLLEASVSEEPLVNRGERQVKVSLELARTAKFINLDLLSPRMLSIGVNDNQDGRSHSIMLKKDLTASHPVELSGHILKKVVTDFRDLLFKYTYENNKKKSPRFDNTTEPGAPISEDFEVAVREMAEFGNSLFRDIFTRSSKEMKAKLRDIRNGPAPGGKEVPIIQITRHDLNNTFPWPIIYDYRLPATAVGGPKAPICMGGKPLVTADKIKRGCPHHPDEEVYCIEGFWSLRYQLEILLGNDKLGNAPSEIPLEHDHPEICMAVGIENSFSDAMCKFLRNDKKIPFFELQPEDDLLEKLWNPQERPALLVMLSHLATNEKQNEPQGPRIIPFPPKRWKFNRPLPVEKWLLEKAIFEYEFDRGAWDQQPQTLVLLIACESAATEIDSLNNFVKAFNSAGAGALVGTECEIFSSMGARFIKEVVPLLYSGVALGAAIQSFNRRLMASGNPLAFSFNCFGNAELKLVSN